MASLPTQSPELLGRIEYDKDIITGVFSVSGEDAIICTSDDKTVKVWVKRDNGQYWPSIVQSFDSPCSALDYEPEKDSDGHHVLVGLGSGQVHEFRLSKDLNRFERIKTHNSHSSRVTSIKLVSAHKWVLSTGRDKRFQWSCTRTGRNLGSHETNAWCLAVEYDETNQYAFVADYSGIINVFKLEEHFSLVTTLRGHTSSVWALSYDQERRILFSGGFDQVIVVWDIGSQQGTAYELTGHSGKIRALSYSSHTRKLLSTAEDGKLGIWDMDTEREETVEWAGSNICEKCSVPFFWNIRAMWDNKIIGVRQHHCRKCGRAICASCSDQMSTYPKMGFEKPVRMCQDCHSSLTTDDRSPMASFLSIKSTITNIHLLQTRGLMVTASEDKQIKIWDITPLMMNH